MRINTKKQLGLLAILILVGQIAFALYSPRYLTPKYSGEIFATTGVVHDDEDLHKLNEAAHYFGQTIIGWIRFPSFMSQLAQEVKLPQAAQLSAYLQERQNIIFELKAGEPVQQETLVGIKDYLQSKIEDYNQVSQTGFVLTNVDYRLNTHQNSYLFGAMATLIISLVIGLGVLFLKHEMSSKKNV